jgi:L-lactate dehydrogenase complex protein LldG
VKARENIIARIRAARRNTANADSAGHEAAHAHVAARTPGPRPQIAGDPRALFRARALALASTIVEVPRRRDVPHAVCEYLTGSGLPLAAVCWPELAELEWAAAGVGVETRAAREKDLVGITGAFCAIAETGTLMFASGPRTPAIVSLLPETHIAVVPAGRIVNDMESAWGLLRSELPAMPRAINFISGPSRTADIEQTVTLGAHGPYRVHIIVIEASETDV